MNNRSAPTMPRTHSVLFLLALLLLLVFMPGCDLRLNPASLDTQVMKLPFTHKNISFNDLTYDETLKRVIVPAGETGVLALINPATRSVQVVPGFSDQPVGSASSMVGATSATVAHGLVFVLDRSAKKIRVVDPAQSRIVGETVVEDTPDIIRFVSATAELWVTEKSRQQIEIFQLNAGGSPRLNKTGSIAIPDGPEGLLIDDLRGLAYTNKPGDGSTAVISVLTHSVINVWGNGCSKARGLAADDDRGYLFVACEEGKVVMMDSKNDGQQLASQSYGGGVDYVAYNPKLKHVYLASGDSALVAVFAITDQPAPTVEGSRAATPTAGPKTPLRLARIGTADTALDARCITVDEQNTVWVCDPRSGQLFYIRDTFTAGG